jgi:hypothetical protein
MLMLHQLQSQYVRLLIDVVVEGDRGPGLMSRVRGQLQQFLNNTWSFVVLTIRDRHGHGDGAWRKRSASNVTASQGVA